MVFDLWTMQLGGVAKVRDFGLWGRVWSDAPALVKRPAARAGRWPGGCRGDAVAMRAGCGAVAETRFIWGRSLPWSRSGRRAGLGIGYLAGAGLVGRARQRAMGALTRSKPGARCSGQRIVYMVRGRFHYRAGALTGCAGRVACAGCTSAGAPALVTIWTAGTRSRSGRGAGLGIGCLAGAGLVGRDRERWRWGR